MVRWLNTWIYRILRYLWGKSWSNNSLLSLCLLHGKLYCLQFNNYWSRKGLFTKGTLLCSIDDTYPCTFYRSQKCRISQGKSPVQIGQNATNSFHTHIRHIFYLILVFGICVDSGNGGTFICCWIRLFYDFWLGRITKGTYTRSRLFNNVFDFSDILLCISSSFV